MKINKKRLLLYILIGCFAFFVVPFIVRAYLWEIFIVPSGSMVPTLLPGDYILVNKYEEAIERGDIIVFEDKLQETLYVKRVIALPGDSIHFKDEKLYINELLLSQEPIQIPNPDDGVQKMSAGPYPHWDKYDFYRESFLDMSYSIAFDRRVKQHKKLAQVNVTIPEGQYFIMGDNRNHSNDSRYFGAIKKEQIIGHAKTVVLSRQLKSNQWRKNRSWISLTSRLVQKDLD